MSAPSSVPCAEPIPYSDDISGYADIDFNVAPYAVQTIQPKVVPVDSILSKQLGSVTNPVQPPSIQSNVYGFPTLPEVGESNAKPLLSSYAGAEISSPMTLSSSNPDTVSVNDITNPPSVAIPPTPIVPPTPIAPQPVIQKFTNVNNLIPDEHKKYNQLRQLNHNNKVNNIQKNNNLANYINNKHKTEHFTNPKKIEHFSKMTLMDNIVIGVILCTFVYYVVTLKHGDSHIDTSKIPIVSQLTDKDVSMENKIIIVVAVVIACVLISRMMK